MPALTQDKKRKSDNAQKPRPHFREQPQDEGHFPETVGADLRLARTGKDLSLEDVARQLRLKPELVRAIEESDFDALPGKTYAIGFVRSYAQLMGAARGAEAEEYVRRFRAEMTDAEELKFNSNTRQDPGRPIPWALLATGAVTLVLAVSVWRMADTAVGAGDDVLDAFQPGLPETVLLLPAGPGDSDAFDAGTVQGEVPASEAETSIPRADIADGTFWGSENYDARLRVKALSDVWLRVEVERQVMFDRVLKAGDSYAPSSRGDVRIMTRNAGDLEIYVDGSYIRRLGKDGDALGGARLDPDALLGGR